MNLKEIRDRLSLEDYYTLLQNWGGEPIYTNFGIISHTICHNPLDNLHSYKLYFYSNSKLFICYTQGCGNDGFFDIFELCQKVFKIQKHKEISLPFAASWVANFVGLAVSGMEDEDPDNELIDDWQILSNYDRLQLKENNNQEFILAEYDNEILNYFDYNIKIEPWLKEGISQETIDLADIGYYLGGDQITIPHFDINNRLIGIRGRTVCQQEAEMFGKYRPLKVNRQLYNHPIGLNLYGLNLAKNGIKQMKKAIIFEAEKSVLKYISYFGIDNDIAVATCGSSLSYPQVQLLLNLGVEEIIIAFDKQYPALNTEESKLWSNKLIKIHNKYKNECLISFMWDKQNLLGYKDSPIDCSKETFLQLFRERIIL